MTADLAGFLLARIAEDEGWARAASPWATGSRDYEQPVDWRRHMWNWSPARVLAECEAKRRIVEIESRWRTTKDVVLTSSADVQRPVRQDVVYYIQFGDRVKVGTTNDLKRRLAQLPYDRVLATEPGSYELERRRHLQLRASRVDGQREWFHLTTEVQAHIATITSG